MDGFVFAVAGVDLAVFWDDLREFRAEKPACTRDKNFQFEPLGFHGVGWRISSVAKGVHQCSFSTYHRMVDSRDCGNEVWGCQFSSDRILEESRLYLKSCPGRSSTKVIRVSGLRSVFSISFTISMFGISFPAETL